MLRNRLGFINFSRRQYNRGRSMQTSKDIPSHFVPTSDTTMTKKMLQMYHEALDRISDADIIIVGAGVAGLTCCLRITQEAPELKVVLLDRNIAPGGTSWTGSQNNTTMCIRKPADEILADISVPIKSDDESFVTVNSTQFTAGLIHKAIGSKQVTFCGGVNVSDFLSAGGKMTGVAVTMGGEATTEKELWRLANPSPLLLHCITVVSACGGVDGGKRALGGFHRLHTMPGREWGELAGLPIWGAGPLDMNTAEDAIVHHTRVVVPGLIMAGVEIAYLDGCGLPGPTNGAMIQSGLKAGTLAVQEVKKNKDFCESRKVAMETAEHFIQNI